MTLKAPSGRAKFNQASVAGIPAPAGVRRATLFRAPALATTKRHRAVAGRISKGGGGLSRRA